MAFNNRTKVKEILASAEVGKSIVVKGWVRTKRSNKNVTFIALNDGSVISNFQIVADPSQISEEILKKVTTGACISAEGVLAASQGAGQSVELLAKSIEILGGS